MRIADRVTDLIGNTPLVRLHGLSEETGAEIIGKIEYFNPLSSIKDRIGLAMIEAAERGGVRGGGFGINTILLDGIIEFLQAKIQ